MAGYDFINAAGVIVPDFAGTLAEVQAEFRAIEGWADIDLSPETPQGALCVAEAIRRDAIARNNALLANQINPGIATGVFLDGLMALMGGQRHPATRSILYAVELTGRPGTIVPAGSVATDGASEWTSLATVIIPAGGLVTVDFQASEPGPITCGVGELVTIAQSVLGWEGVHNPTAAVVGRDRESDLMLRRRRERTLAAQGRESVEAIVSALYALQDVRSLSFWENYTPDPITHQGVTLIPHSMYLCIDGGDPDEIAYALKRVRGIGPGYNGSEVVQVEDQITGQMYTVKFDRPDPVSLQVRVTVRPSIVNAPAVVPDLVRAWADGQAESDPGVMVGRDVSPFEIASAINEQEPRLTVLAVELSDDSGASWSMAAKTILIDEIAVIGNVSVVVA